MKGSSSFYIPILPSLIATDIVQQTYNDFSLSRVLTRPRNYIVTLCVEPPQGKSQPLPRLMVICNVLVEI